jgi:tRNA(Arg) A34 adenosine deaminase TadA
MLPIMSRHTDKRKIIEEICMLSATEKMRLTLQLAEEAMSNGECPIAAAVFLDDEMIAGSFTKEFRKDAL